MNDLTNLLLDYSCDIMFKRIRSASEAYYKNLSYRLMHVMNTHNKYTEIRINYSNESQFILVQVDRYDEYKVCVYWSHVYDRIYEYSARHSSELNCPFIKKDMSYEEVDLQLQIRGY